MKVDMSSEAVTARLKLASQLRHLCLKLGKARPVDDLLTDSIVTDVPLTYEPLKSAQESVSARPRRLSRQSTG